MTAQGSTGNVLAAIASFFIPGNSAEGAGQAGAVQLNGQRVRVTAGGLEDDECSTACDGNQVLTKRGAERGLATFHGQGGVGAGQHVTVGTFHKTHLCQITREGCLCDINTFAPLKKRRKLLLAPHLIAADEGSNTSASLNGTDGGGCHVHEYTSRCMIMQATIERHLFNISGCEKVSSVGPTWPRSPERTGPRSAAVLVRRMRASTQACGEVS